jgi:predicted secreted protein
VPEPTVSYGYELFDGNGIAIKPRDEFNLTEEEKNTGLYGLIDWNNRIRHLDYDIDLSRIRAWATEVDGREIPLVQFDLTVEDGYCKFSGMFPITIKEIGHGHQN